MMNMDTYRAFLSARALSEQLLMQYMEKGSDFHLREARRILTELQERIALIDGKAKE
jgi:hypothetical protein